MNRQKIARELVMLARELVGKKGEVPEAFKKQWKNKDKDNDGKENEPKPDFLKKKKSSDVIASSLVTLAKELTAKTYPQILPDNRENRKLWQAIDDAVDSIVDGYESGDTPPLNPLIRSLSKGIWRKFREVPLDTVEHYLTEEFHDRDLTASERTAARQLISAKKAFEKTEAYDEDPYN